MDPITMMMIASIAAPMISKMFGGNSEKKYQRQVARITGPGNVGMLTNQFYQQGLQSPAFSQAQGAIAQGANQTSNNVAANLAARGIGTSGTGAILSSLTPSLVGNQQAGLRTSVYQGAQGQANNQIQALLAALAGSHGQPSQTAQYGAAGLDALGPMLMKLLAGHGGGAAIGGAMQGGSAPWQGNFA